MFGDFVTLAMDQIVNQAAKLRYMTGGQARIPLVIRMVTGTAGATAAQHSQSLEAWFVHTPGLKVVTASTPEDAKGLLKTAIRDPDPVLFFEHKLLYNTRGPVPDGEYTVPLGEGRVVRAGTDVTVVAYLAMVPRALTAAAALEAEGVSVEVWDPRSLVPFDMAGLQRSLAKTGRLVIVHEAPRRAGVGAEIAARVAEDAFSLLRAPIVRVAGLNAPVPYAPVLEETVLPSVARIAEAIRAVVRTARG